MKTALRAYEETGPAHTTVNRYNHANTTRQGGNGEILITSEPSGVMQTLLALVEPQQRELTVRREHVEVPSLE
ncbi:MAG TPA: hypothetical protein VL096_02110, partial [Pirellulaceae bacterium]|nr:hypothetical protein [Pirellulaceae bacterium]